MCFKTLHAYQKIQLKRYDDLGTEKVKLFEFYNNQSKVE